MSLAPLRRGSFLVLCLCLARCASEALEEPDTDGDGRVGRQDCDRSSDAHWSDCATCVDDDGDDHGEGCDLGPDCDDSAATGAYCDSGCFNAKRDADHDGFAELGGEVLTICAFTREYGGVDAPEDCDDADGRHWLDCAACADADDDGFGTGCDQGVDCDDADARCSKGCITAYVDDDGDGVGHGAALSRCDLGDGWAATTNDCDDTTETGLDCDDTCTSFFGDADSDGVGDSGILVSRCGAPSGFVALAGDCDPASRFHWSDCGLCDDVDGDGRGPSCDWDQDDCDPVNPNVWVRCAACRDADHDGAFTGCDAYATVTEDCNERDPLIHPGAVDFPDNNGIAEDCDPSSEPQAADGVGIYVSSDCSGTELGTIVAPFCTLAAALAASQPGASIFVAAGQYAMPSTVSSVRIFGGYLPGWTGRSPSRTATSFTNATPSTGVVLDDVLIHNATYFHTMDCDACAALTVGGGGARLADFDVAMENTATDCTSIQVSSGDAVLVRTKVFGAACVNHRVVAQNDRATVIWKSELQAGSPGNVTQEPAVFWGAGKLVVGESVLSADGARATTIQSFSGGSLDLQSVRISAQGVDGISEGIAHAGTLLRVVNSLIDVSSTAGTAFPLTVSSGTADVFHTHLTGVGAGVTALQIATSETVRVINDVLSADGSAGSYGLNIPNPGSQVTVQTNDFQVSGAGSVCAMLVEGICGDPIGVNGNIQATGCSNPRSTDCTRAAVGTPLEDEFLPRVDIDYVERFFGWDIGAYAIPFPIE